MNGDNKSIQLEAYEILEALRNRPAGTVKVSDLLKSEGGHLPTHTGAGVFGAAIACLLDGDFIKLSDESGRDITSGVASVGHPGDWTLRRGYDIAERGLRGKERYISVLLTQKLADLQSTLGISLTDLRANADGRGMVVRPLFRKPQGYPSTHVFVLMPFDEILRPVYDDHIRKVCAEIGLMCARADSLFGSREIMNDVWELICNAEIIIADCTGRNPNVFYELGVAHTVGKNVIVTTQNMDDIPFDVRHMRCIHYAYTPRGMHEFESALKDYIQSARKTSSEWYRWNLSKEKK